MASIAIAVDVSTRIDQASRRFDVVVIGAGQAGLSMAYYLKQLGLNFVVLDERERVGDIWRSRWDSLRLFTPAKHDALPGMRFPAPSYDYPTGHQVADYLESYAGQMNLPVRTGVKVDGLWPANDSQSGFVVTAGNQRFETQQVVVATGTQDRPRIPAFAAELDPRIEQLHSSQYLRPSQLKERRSADRRSGELRGRDRARGRTRAYGHSVRQRPRTAPLPDRPAGSSPRDSGALVPGEQRLDGQHATRPQSRSLCAIWPWRTTRAREAIRYPGSRNRANLRKNCRRAGRPAAARQTARSSTCQM